jgi:hypothetical protein
MVVLKDQKHTVLASLPDDVLRDEVATRAELTKVANARV